MKVGQWQEERGLWEIGKRETWGDPQEMREDMDQKEERKQVDKLRS